MNPQEWLCGLSLVQPEEADRISKFVFRRDAKLALVRHSKVWICVQ